MKNKNVDAYLKSEKKWPKEVTLLRDIVRECKLQEDFKWSMPCYTSDDKNIVIIQSFKNFCALLFFKGAQLKDPKKLLKAPGKNSHIGRRLEFTSLEQVSKCKTAIKGFIKESLQIKDSPTKAVKKAVKVPSIPVELLKEFNKNKKLKVAFDKLTPGRQRMYLIHFSSAKQEATRISRIKKCIPKIMAGLGLTE